MTYSAVTIFVIHLFVQTHRVGDLLSISYAFTIQLLDLQNLRLIFKNLFADSTPRFENGAFAIADPSPFNFIVAFAWTEPGAVYLIVSAVNVLFFQYLFWFQFYLCFEVFLILLLCFNYQFQQIIYELHFCTLTIITVSITSIWLVFDQLYSSINC